jgi:hypothetical protein
MTQFLGCNKVVLQSNNTQVIDTKKKGGFSVTLFATISEDCELLATSVRDIKFEQCNREANEVAHELARHSFNNRAECFLGQ